MPHRDRKRVETLRVVIATADRLLTEARAFEQDVEAWLREREQSPRIASAAEKRPGK